MKSSQSSEGEIPDRNLLEDAFCTGTPLIEDDTTVVFVFKGQAESVAVMGDMTDWADSIALTRLEEYRPVLRQGQRSAEGADRVPACGRRAGFQPSTRHVPTKS